MAIFIQFMWSLTGSSVPSGTPALSLSAPESPIRPSSVAILRRVDNRQSTIPTATLGKFRWIKPNLAFQKNNPEDLKGPPEPFRGASPRMSPPLPEPIRGHPNQSEVIRAKKNFTRRPRITSRLGIQWLKLGSPRPPGSIRG